MRVCHYCGAPATTRDHIVPSSLGGFTRPFNLVPACQPCNTAKGAKLPTCKCDKCRWALSRWHDGEGWNRGYDMSRTVGGYQPQTVAEGWPKL
jgi:hypothetical protein